MNPIAVAAAGSLATRSPCAATAAGGAAGASPAEPEQASGAMSTRLNASVAISRGRGFLLLPESRLSIGFILG